MTITKEDKQAALVHLAEWFPQTFVLEKYLPHRPLKIGIAPTSWPAAQFSLGASWAQFWASTPRV